MEYKLYSTVQHSTAQHSTAQHSAVQHSRVNERDDLYPVKDLSGFPSRLTVVLFSEKGVFLICRL
jgi:hypothetical protein